MSDTFLSQKSGEKEDIIRLYFEKAKKALIRSKANLKDDDIEAAVDRAYYSVFYTMTALMTYYSDIRYNFHKGLISNFNKMFIMTEFLPRELGNKIQSCQRYRHQGDYEPYNILTKEIAEEQISLAEFLYEKCLEFYSDVNTLEKAKRKMNEMINASLTGSKCDKDSQ